MKLSSRGRRVKKTSQWLVFSQRAKRTASQGATTSRSGRQALSLDSKSRKKVEMGSTETTIIEKKTEIYQSSSMVPKEGVEPS